MKMDDGETRFILTNGNIYTLDPQNLHCQAMAIRGEKIYALGSSEEVRSLASMGFQEQNLGGKTVLPGFIDTHCHAISFGMNLKTWLGVQDVESVEDLQERVRERVRRIGHGDWIKGRGWCKGVLHKRMPTRWDLDEVAPDNPVVLIDSTGHMAVVNSKVLELSGVDRSTKFMTAGKIDRDPNSGEPNGILRESALYELAWMKGPQPTDEEILDAARLICQRTVQEGVTSLSSIMITFPSEDEKTRGYTPREIKPFVTLRQRNELPLRIRLMIQAYRTHATRGSDHTFVDRLIGLGLASGFGDDRLEIGGIKIIADGSIMANTGAMREPYCNEPDSKGILHFTQEQLDAIVLKANQNDLQVEIHAHGDRAVDVTLQAYEQALKNTKGKELRNIITHVRVLHDEQIKKIKGLGLMVNGVPGVNGWLPTRFAVEAFNVGKERAPLLSRLRTLIDQGVTVAGGSDGHPCHPYGPMHYIYRAVNQGNFSYEDPLTLDEAIRLWTKNAAYISFGENKKGSLECGKLADFIILSDDPYTTKKNLDQIKVEKTFVGGKMVWNREAPQ